MWTQLVTPNADAQGRPFYCLEMTQKIYGAPVRYADATQASNNTKFRHYTKELPNVSVPVWFDMTVNGHNYGHVVGYFPGRGFLNVPGSGYGQKWLNTLEDVERFNKCTFKFWSEDINGLRVAENTPDPILGDEEDMKLLFWNNTVFFISKQYMSVSPDGRFTEMMKRLYGEAITVDEHDFNRIARAHGVPDEVRGKLYNNNNANIGYAWSIERGYFSPDKAK